MIARRPIALLLLLAALTAARAAAPATPPPTLDPKGAIPSGPPPAAAKKSPAPTPAAITPATKSAKPPDAAAKLPAAAEVEPPASDTATVTLPTGAPEAIKPGILSAVKAKGPPPVSKTPAPPIPLSPRFQQVRTRIGALFNTRNAPPAPADPRSNPFRPVGAVPATPVSTTDAAAMETVAVNNDLVSLQQAVATLRVKGTFQRGKVAQLVITSAPGKEGTYKEGDIINVLLPPGDPVHVRVRQISKNSVTLTLNDAEMVLKF